MKLLPFLWSIVLLKGVPMMEFLNITFSLKPSHSFSVLLYIFFFSEQVTFRDTHVTQLKHSLQSWWCISLVHQWCWGVFVSKVHGHNLLKITDPEPDMAGVGSSVMDTPPYALMSESLWTTALTVSGSPWRENSLVNKMWVFWLS